MDSGISQQSKGRIKSQLQTWWAEQAPVDQLLQIFPFLIKLYLPVLLLLGIVAWTGLRYGINFGTFMRDPATEIGFPPYVGLVSNLGILLWTAPAAIALFCAALLRHRRDSFHFYLAGGLLTTLLMLDDFFLLHEAVFPDYLAIPEKVVMVVYLLLVMGFLLRFSLYILTRTEYLLLLVAVGFIGASTLWDFFVPTLPGYYLYEDGLKFCGVVAWAAYFARSGLSALRREADDFAPRSTDG